MTESHKRKRQASSADSNDARSSLLAQSAEMAFPRGGASVLTPLELKEISNEAKQDALFEQQHDSSSHKQPATKKQKKSKSSSKIVDAIVGSTTKSSENVTIDNLSFKVLNPGSMVLGQIKQINKMELVLSLSDNLNGFIPITNISEEMTKLLQEYDDQQDDESDESEDDQMNYGSDDEENENKVTRGIISDKKQVKEFPELKSRFQIGQWLRAKVVESSTATTKKAKAKKRIELSIEPEQVNSAMDEDEDLIPNSILQVSIKSLEDHGAILNTGKSKLSGFISKKELLSGGYELESLAPGSVLLTTITKNNKRTITCKIPYGAAKKQSIVQTISSIDSILPGMLVDALVSDVSKFGLNCKVYGVAKSSITMSHLGVFDATEIKHKFALGSTLKARIIAVYKKNGEKKLQLSLLPHVQTLNRIGYNPKEESDPLEAFPVGHVFDDVVVKGKDSQFIFVNVGSKNVLGQAHISRITKGTDLDMDLKCGSNHKARVLGFSQVDNMFILTMDQKQIEEKFLTFEDIPFGDLVNCEILRFVSDKGLQVKISENFEGFVPIEHMSDIKLIYPERKFKIGMKVKGRILRIQHHGGRHTVYVTLKKSLVNIEDDEVVAKIEDAEIGKRTPATIEKFHPGGCIVTFFGYVKAFLPNVEISETFVKKPEDHFKLGQTVKVRILSVDQEKKRIKVSCRVSDALSDIQKKAMSALVPGKSVVKVQVVEREKESVVVELAGSNLRGLIYSGQLSDGNYEQNRAALKRLEIGSTLEALVLEKDTRSRIVKLTSKESLVKASTEGSFPTSYKDIAASDKILHGYVKSITSNGLFVAFGNGLTGLVLPRYASDKKIDDLSESFFVNQSVSCHVVRADDSNKRFLLSLKKDINDSVASAAINPVDPEVKTLNQFVPGKVTKAKIKSIKGTQLNVQLADNQQGRIDITQLFDNFESIKDVKKPLAEFKNGDVLDVKIIGYHDARNHRFLPISHRKNNKQVILELSAKKSVINSQKEFVSTSIADLSTGDEVVSFINNFGRGYLWVSISPSLKGKISLMNLANDASSFSNLEKEFPIGCALKVKVETVDNEHNLLTLTAKEKSIKSVKDVKVGDIVPAKVLKTRESYVLVELGDGVTAISFITDALNDYSDKLDDIFSTNDICAATILEVDIPNNKIHVSLRTSDAKDKSINSVEDLKKGDVVRGFIKNVAKNGIYVALGRNVYSLIRVSDLSDSYLKEWKQFYRVHQPVLGKVLKADEEGKVSMTLKDSEVNGDLNILKRFDDIQVGDIYEGFVKRVTDFGVFVKLDGCNNVVGLCHHTEISDNEVENIQNIFGEGDRVKVKILVVDLEKKQLSLGMKASYFTAASSESKTETDEDGDAVMADADSEDDSDDEDELVDTAYAHDDNSSDSGSDYSDAENVEDSGEDDALATGLSTGFDWTASILEQAKEEESSDDEDNFEDEGKKNKKKKKSTKPVEDKTADINSRKPESVSDFERLLVGNPDSSVLWINYIAFQLNLSEIEKAREVGERALKIINYREEQEKLNIWIAMLNLENTFGSDESLEEVFKRSCQYMDSFTMHQKLVAIYIASEKFKAADQLYRTICKKFGSEHVSVWVAYSSFLFDREDSEGARMVLPKSMQVLAKRDHIDVVKKFAQLEFKKGDHEQGRSLFEGLLAEAPKRIDMWNVYIDQEIRAGDKKKVEELFERVVTKKLSKKQAKFFFGKWLDFEEKQGDDKASDYVKAKAAEYVQSQTKN